MRKSIYTPPSSPPSLEEMDEEQGHTPVESLRIRTPDFSTHEDADRVYAKRRAERAQARRCWTRTYTGGLFMASWVGARNFCVGAGPLTADAFVLATVIGAAFTVSCLAAYSLCKGMLGSAAAPAPAATHEKSDYDEEESIGAHV